MPGMNGISAETTISGNNMLEMIQNGKVKEHIMTNSSLSRHGDIEHKEMIQYSDFIRSKWGYDLLQLNGNCMYE